MYCRLLVHVVLEKLCRCSSVLCCVGLEATAVASISDSRNTAIGWPSHLCK